MKAMIYMLLLAFLSFPGMGQETDDGKSKKEQKKERKESRKLEALEDLQKANDLVRERQWVLETHTLFGRFGDSFQVNPTINFVAVDGDNCVIQLGFEHLVGWNGLGGVTFEGKVKSYKIYETGDGKGVSLRAEFFGAGRNLSMFLNVSGVNSDIRLRGNWGGRLRMAGQIVHPEESRVYKGQPVF